MRSGRKRKEETLTVATDRFERRLVEETSKLRVELANVETRLLAKMGDLKADLLKWSFIFWIGQVFAMTAIMSAMVR